MLTHTSLGLTLEIHMFSGLHCLTCFLVNKMRDFNYNLFIYAFDYDIEKLN